MIKRFICWLWGHVHARPIIRRGEHASGTWTEYGYFRPNFCPRCGRDYPLEEEVK